MTDLSKLCFPLIRLAAVVDDLIGQLDFLRQWPLGLDPCIGVLLAEVIPCLKALPLLFGCAGDYPDFRAEVRKPCFKKKGNHQNNSCTFVELLELLAESCANDWMDQLFKPLAF